MYTQLLHCAHIVCVMWFAQISVIVGCALGEIRCVLLRKGLVYVIQMNFSLTPWSTVLLEKLTGSQPVKLPAFYGTRRFLTAFTHPRHLSLSWASSIQSMPPRPTAWGSILILSSHLRLGLQVFSFPQVSLPKPCIRLSSPPYLLHAPPISFFSI